MRVFKSRLTPNLDNGKNVKFEIGEKVTYKLTDGKINIIIDSELMVNQGYYGYEAIFLDDNQKYFAVSEQIVGWEGKINN